MPGFGQHPWNFSSLRWHVSKWLLTSALPLCFHYIMLPFNYVSEALVQMMEISVHRRAAWKCYQSAWIHIWGKINYCRWEYYTWNHQNLNTFVAVITFSPFFCADTFDTSLLLILCALRWYVKSLYKHLFLEDISKHARVTQKMALPNLWHT